MTDAKMTPPAKPPTRWLRPLLFMSLTLNLVILGIVAGAVFGRHERGRDEIVTRDLGFGPFNDAFSEADRKALRDAYRAAKPDLGAERDKMRKGLQETLAVLRAEPFQPDALRAVLDAGGARAVERQQIGRDIVIGQLSKMTTAERAGFADRLEHSLQRKSNRGRRSDHSKRD
ncbi:periplasmic heavy metal sensor [Pseudorhodobacter sp.]|uniref:periplasmic heavy metal sensor n=1 Tax=Pseudorhodobacter sp. TaxID=1934400 RepID=UPI00264888CC|nr:periplasmic heavy metal sensor [Pseudorhodobacter sp.]MDN5787374.1 periplasmic heavy metal sensor [Pseudorhodobacter sp.]